MADNPKGLISDKINEIKDTYAHMDVSQRPVFLMRKTEKLANAVYKVTEPIHESEPVKWRLRDAALELLVLIVAPEKNGGGNIKRKVSIVDKINLFLEMSHVGSYVSAMNFSILKDEYVALRELMLLSDTNTLEKRHFEIAEKDIISTQKDIDAQEVNYIKDISKGQAFPARSRKRAVHLPEKISEKKKVKRDTAPREVPEKGHRRERITGFIRARGEVSIKDILDEPSIASGVSSKTIQRELVDMVSEGILQKTGERRWSRYSAV